MKILIRVPNWVGDAVMCIPALEAIRARWPDPEIALLGREWVSGIFQGQPWANRVLVFEHTRRHRGFFGLERLAREIRKERFDIAVLLQNAFQAAWLAWRAGVPQRIGYARDGRSWLLTKAIPVPKTGETPAHESYYYLELLRRAGWMEKLPALERIRLHVPPEAMGRAEEFLDRAGVPGAPRMVRVAMAPGAAYGSAKCWPVERYAALADRLIAEFGADVILFGSAAEREVTGKIAAGMKRKAVQLAGETQIAELPALFASCDLFVGNDSGAMHVAAAVGLPVVAVFGPTDPEGTAPMTPRRTLVQQKVECSPCFLRHCPIDHRCMTRVEVEAVYSAAREWIKKGSASLA
ncbi:MAG: lipopolysaccharide heptosyltransferase II [Acidobacteria bacterium]|nr:lipopolysaccharide heptosyltransferase II [Acidobacteriota bacterium]MCL5289328.1 lipopolysaccharide heptosyltransferase II [Acidobacteriota bacterium]